MPKLTLLVLLLSAMLLSGCDVPECIEREEEYIPAGYRYDCGFQPLNGYKWGCGVHYFASKTKSSCIEYKPLPPTTNTDD